jgi:hypothetical protein
MAEAVIGLLDHADITANVSTCLNYYHCDLMTTFQVGHWTLDNAANNGTFMEHLEILLRLRDIDFDAEDRRIMCFPHIINICCQHIIKEFTNVELVDAAAPTQTPGPSNALSYEDAVKRDPIARGRNVVHVLRASGQ